jgi:hypothetical protein
MPFQLIFEPKVIFFLFPKEDFTIEAGVTVFQTGEVLIEV